MDIHKSLILRRESLFNNIGWPFINRLLYMIGFITYQMLSDLFIDDMKIMIVSNNAEKPINLK